MYIDAMSVYICVSLLHKINWTLKFFFFYALKQFKYHQNYLSLKTLVEFPCKTVWNELFFKKVSKYLTMFSLSSMAVCLLFLSLLGSILTNYFFLIEVSISSSCQMLLHKVEQSLSSVQFSRSVKSDSATPWTTARQASLSITNAQSLPKPMSIESVMPSNHLILCHPLLPPSIFPSIRVFSNESVLVSGG